MFSDEDVERLLEEADPARRLDRRDGRIDGARFLSDLRQEINTVTLTESSPAITRPSRLRAAAVAVAAAAIVIAGGAILLTQDDEPPSSAVAADMQNTAELFVGAVNERDVAAIEAMATDGLTIDIDGVTDGALPADDLPSLMAWYDAFEWRWEDPSCEPTSPGVQCVLFERNRLTDLSGAERPATVTLAMVGGQIDSVRVRAVLADYRVTAFRPFLDWVRLNHPDDEARMWVDGGVPVLTTESVALFDQYLGEYTAGLFIGAVNERDVAAIEAMSTDGFTIEVDGVTDGALPADELPSLMAWYDAFGWRWEDASCGPTTTGVRCELSERNRLTDVSGAQRPATVTLAMVDGQVDSVTVTAVLADYRVTAFQPFLRWVRLNHPDDEARMWFDGGVPVLTAESVALFDQYLTEHTGSP